MGGRGSSLSVGGAVSKDAAVPYVTGSVSARRAVEDSSFEGRLSFLIRWPHESLRTFLGRV